MRGEKWRGTFKKILCFLRKGKKDSPVLCGKTAERLSGRHIKYVIERENNIDVVIGKNAHMNITPGGEEFAVTRGIDTLFRARIDEMRAGELLSGDGVILSAFDLDRKRQRTIVAYYKYHR